MRPGLRSLRALVLVVLALWGMVLGGCLGGAPRDHFYRLEVPPAESRFEVPPLQGTVEVEPLRADPLVGGRRILRGPTPGSVELVPHRYHLWVDSPTLSIQRALVTDLRTRGLAERVVTQEMLAEEDWRVVGRVVVLEHDGGAGAGSVLVELDLALTNSEGDQRGFSATYREEESFVGHVDAAAQAMGEAVGRIFERFAADAAAHAAES
jgi:ABC-type uncharacterized transport system auxiliary subunit